MAAQRLPSAVSNPLAAKAVSAFSRRCPPAADNRATFLGKVEVEEIMTSTDGYAKATSEAYNARAAEIYSHITSRNRDPALIEMVGKNTFRARIFPVEPNADLKVEIKIVQTLPADLRSVLQIICHSKPVTRLHKNGRIADDLR